MKNRLMRKLRDERGIALVMAMGMLLAMSIALTGVIYFTSTNSRSSSFAKQEQSAVALAEAGINNALAALLDRDSVDGLTDPNALGARETVYSGGTVTWSGELKQDCDSSSPPVCQQYWLISSTGAVVNPTGPNTSDISRTLTARVNLKPPPVVDKEVEIWNWVYSHRTNDTGACDMTIDQGVEMYAPVYVRGNLCMRSTARIFTGPLVVGGYLTMSEPQTGVGFPSAPLTEKVRIVGSCQWWNKPTVAPQCRPEPWTPNTNVWATDFANTLSPFNVSLPPVWWGDGHVPNTGEEGWYELASPGPSVPCKTASGTPPVFDTDTSLNGSVPGVFNLTPPAESYTCITKRGQLSWDHAKRQLTLRGVIFIDGDVKIENNTGPITYRQQEDRTCPSGAPLDYDCDRGAVIYIGGTLRIWNSKVCAVVNGSTCNLGGWQPNENLIVFAVFDHGRQLPDPEMGIQVRSSAFQGALYAQHNIDVSTTSVTQGPLVSEQEVRLGQTNGADFPAILIDPVGMPGFGPEFWTTAEPVVG
jgi:Tfp pilus assembly protein PilX